MKKVILTLMSMLTGFVLLFSPVWADVTFNGAVPSFDFGEGQWNGFDATTGQARLAFPDTAIITNGTFSFTDTDLLAVGTLLTSESFSISAVAPGLPDNAAIELTGLDDGAEITNQNTVIMGNIDIKLDSLGQIITDPSNVNVTNAHLNFDNADLSSDKFPFNSDANSITYTITTLAQ